MVKDAESPRYRAPALDKGLDILELLAAQPGGMTRSEIVRAMGMKSPSEIYRMLERLVARDYVSRSFEGDRYALTMKLFHLGALFPPLRRLVRQAQPLMDDFAVNTMQSVHLVVADIGHAHVVAQASSRAAWEFRLRVGVLLDLLTTSSGRTLLAFQDDEQAAQMLRAAGSEAKALTPALRAELDEVRANGFRKAPSKQLVGVTDLSVPIRSVDGHAVAVLTCPFLPRVESRDDGLAEVDLDGALERLLQTAEQLSKT